MNGPLVLLCDICLRDKTADQSGQEKRTGRNNNTISPPTLPRLRECGGAALSRRCSQNK